MTTTEKTWNVAIRGEDAKPMPKATSLEIAVYDVIGKDFWSGEGITSQDFLENLRLAPNARTISLRVNTIGGIVDEAKAMVNLLAERASAGVDITGFVDGIAASCGSYLLTVCKRVVMPSNSFQMLHRVRGGMSGNADQLATLADVIRRIDNQLAEAYAAASARRGKGKTKEDFLAAFAKGDLYLSADEAIEWGLADEKIEALKLAACLADLTGIENAPEALRSAPYVQLTAKAEPPAPPPAAAQPPTPPAPVARAPQDPPTGKGTVMSNEDNKNTNYASIVASLGLIAGATETDILNRIGRLRDLETQALAILGVSDSAQLVGSVRGVKAKADTADALQAELTTVKGARDKQTFESLIAKGQADRKLTPAEAKHETDKFNAAVAEGRGDRAVKDLEGYLAVAPRKFNEAAPAPAHGKGANPGSMTWNGKAYTELSFPEKHKLAKDDPELFEAMKADHDRTAA